MTDAVETVSRAAGPVLVILVVALVIYAVARIVGRIVGQVLYRRMDAAEAEGADTVASRLEARRRFATVTALVDWVFRVLIGGFAVLAILVVLDLTPVIAAVLLVIAVVAVVARDVIRDHVGGMLVVLENQYSIGDWVRIAGEYGEVEALSLRRTLLRSEGGDLITVPNGDIRTVANRTRGWARVDVRFAIADPADLPAARAAIDQAGRDLEADPTTGPALIEPPGFVMVEGIDDTGIRLMVWGRVRAADRFRVEGEYRRRLLERLAEAGVSPVTAHRVRLVDGVPPA